MDMPPILKPEQAAELLGCEPKTVQERLRTGDLPGEKFGVDWVLPTHALLQRVNEISVEKMLERRKRPSPEAPLVLVGKRGRGRRAPPALS